MSWFWKRERVIEREIVTINSTEITVVRVEPQDIICLFSDGIMSDKAWKNVSESIRGQFKCAGILAFEDKLRFGVIKGGLEKQNDKPRRTNTRRP